MATFTNRQLAVGALSAVLSTLYTAPPSTRTILTSVTVCNTGGSVRTVTMKIAGTSLLKAMSLDANETVILHPNTVLETGNLIQGNQDAGSDVEFTLSGVEIT